MSTVQLVKALSEYPIVLVEDEDGPGTGYPAKPPWAKSVFFLGETDPEAFQDPDTDIWVSASALYAVLDEPGVVALAGGAPGNTLLATLTKLAKPRARELIRPRRFDITQGSGAITTYGASFGQKRPVLTFPKEVGIVGAAIAEFDVPQGVATGSFKVAWFGTTAVDANDTVRWLGTLLLDPEAGESVEAAGDTIGSVNAVNQGVGIRVDTNLASSVDLIAGKSYRLVLERLCNNPADTYTGQADVLRVEVAYA